VFDGRVPRSALLHWRWIFRALLGCLTSRWASSTYVGFFNPALGCLTTYWALSTSRGVLQPSVVLFGLALGWSNTCCAV
jgi:hypothetical protein